MPGASGISDTRMAQNPGSLISYQTALEKEIRTANADIPSHAVSFDFKKGKRIQMDALPFWRCGSYRRSRPASMQQCQDSKRWGHCDSVTEDLT